MRLADVISDMPTSDFEPAAQPRPALSPASAHPLSEPNARAARLPFDAARYRSFVGDVTRLFGSCGLVVSHEVVNTSVIPPPPRSRPRDTTALWLLVLCVVAGLALLRCSQL